MTDALRPSKLGTKEHWDNVYREELIIFEEIGDEGEVWFGEESVRKVIDWTIENVPSSSIPRIVEVGSGNGNLLLALAEAGYSTSHLAGVDYSAGAVKLARFIAGKRGHDVTFYLSNFLESDPPLLFGMKESPEGVWDLILDKGTFDAIALGVKDEDGKSPVSNYLTRVAKLVRPGGYFLITSCNFTEEELQAHFCVKERCLIYHSHIEHPTYEFGGKRGSMISSVAFQRIRT